MSEKIVQYIDIDAPGEVIFDELITWGESAWWPKACRMRFKNISGFIGKNTIYRQKVKLPFGPCWRSRTECIDREKLFVRRVFSGGMFEGCEELLVSADCGSCRANYSFCAGVKGRVNKFFWRAWGRREHIKNIDLILQALRRYLEKRSAGE